MAPATTVKASTAVKSTCSAGWPEAMETASSDRCAATKPFTTAESTVEPDSTTAVEARTAAIESSAAVEPMEPGTRTDKHAARKIIGAIVTIRSTCVRRIPVVAILTYRSRPNVSGARIDGSYSNANPEPDLRAGRSSHRQTQPKQNRIF
jgi:hypothetical protein